MDVPKSVKGPTYCWMTHWSAPPLGASRGVGAAKARGSKARRLEYFMVGSTVSVKWMTIEWKWGIDMIPGV